MTKTILAAAFLLISTAATAQTSCSLFLKKDGVQVRALDSAAGATYKAVGHHGPAVENPQMALRLYFNDSGAIDVYNKRKDGLELARYRWYPTPEQQASEGAGVDEYYVGKTVGLGGIALLDGDTLKRPVATEGRRARVGRTLRGHFAEVVARGVEYGGGKVDVTLRIDVHRGSRWARVTARASRKVRFVTGINYPEAAAVRAETGLLSVWGVHPADVAEVPSPIGAALRYDRRRFTAPVDESGQLRICSLRPVRRIKTRVFSASSAQVTARQGGCSCSDWDTYLKNMLSE